MRLIVDKQEILKTLNKIGSCVPSGGIGTAISGVRIEAIDESITISATNLDIYAEEKIKGTIIEEGLEVVEYNLLKNLIGGFPNEELTIKKIKKNKVQLSYGKIKYPIKTFEAEMFPSYPRINRSTNFSIPSIKLKEIMSKFITTTITKDESKPALQGMFMNINKDKNIDFVATDGYRLYKEVYKLKDLELNKITECIIPNFSMNFLKKTLPESEGETIEVSIGDKFIRFENKNTIIISRLINSDRYPKYQGLIPTEFKGVIKVDSESLLNGLKRIKKVNNHYKSNLVDMLITKDKLKAKPEHNDNVGEEEFEIKNTAKNNVAISFSIDYLIDYLNNTKLKEIKFHITNNERQTMFEECDLIYILMPANSPTIEKYKEEAKKKED